LPQVGTPALVPQGGLLAGPSAARKLSINGLRVPEADFVAHLGYARLNSPMTAVMSAHSDSELRVAHKQFRQGGRVELEEWLDSPLDHRGNTAVWMYGQKVI
jgi:hypothetical protein